MTINIKKENKFNTPISTEEKILKERQDQWKTLRVKLDIVLRNNRIFKPDIMLQKCQELDNMNKSGRMEHIRTNWGELYLTKAMPIIEQLDLLEQLVAS